MGFLNSILGDEDTEDVDGDSGGTTYRVAARDPEKKTNASLPDEIEGKEWHFEDPPTKEQFRFDYGDILEGDKEYICAPKDGKYIDLENIEWVIEAEEKVRKRRKREAKRDAELKKEIQSIKEEIARKEAETSKDPEQIKAEAQAEFVKLAAQNPAFIARHAGDVALSALGVERGSDAAVGYDEFSDNPMQAMFYELATNPEKARDLGQNFGGGLGAALDGFVEGAGMNAPANGEAQQAEEGGESEDWRPRDLDAGASSMDELGSGNLEGTAERLAEIAREAQEADTSARDRGGGRDTQDDHGGEPGEITDDEARRAEMNPDQTVVNASETQTGTPETPDDAAEPGVNAAETTTQTPETGGDAGTKTTDTDRCQYVKDNGEQCGNPSEDGSNYCWVEGHGPDTGDDDEDEEIKGPQDAIKKAREITNDE